ncbi:MAG: altronate dehydrogenase [Chloroflexota bacterium]
MTAGAPARVLQLGTGRFVRGFVDTFLDDANAAAVGERAWAVTAVESTGSGRASALAAQGGAFRLLVRGLRDRAVVDEARTIRSIDVALDGASDPAAVEAAAADPAVRVLVSNVTEAGYAAGAGGFPDRLLDLLLARDRAGLRGLTLLPLELIERNGDRLRTLVDGEAARREVDPLTWASVRGATTWGVTLVDRITTTPDPALPGVAGDPLAVAVEPFASWVVELPADAAWPLPEHPAIVRTADVGPYALRKIRLLNGAHTALVARCRGTSITFVREAMADPTIATWLEALLREELVPALGDRIVDGEAFATDVLERFRNPFLDHRLADIALHHEAKLGVRLVPTYHDHVARFGRPPVLLGRLLESEGVSL